MVGRGESEGVVSLVNRVDLVKRFPEIGLRREKRSHRGG